VDVKLKECGGALVEWNRIKFGHHVIVIWDLPSIKAKKKEASAVFSHPNSSTYFKFDLGGRALALLSARKN